ncbi:MAG: porin family protein [Desulfobacterales bacterium]|nr:porin family protein [Desulfobacterales bacterium]
MAVFISSACSAADMYFSVKTGVTVPADSDATFAGGDSATFEFDPGVSVMCAIGGQINERMRIEPELAYQKNDLDQASSSGASASADGDLTSISFLTNFYYDFINESPFTPYLSAGIGFAQIEVDDIASAVLTESIGSDEDTVFAYQFSGGIGWALGERVTLDFSYRYYATEEPHFTPADSEFKSHNLYAGARFSF